MIPLLIGAAAVGLSVALMSDDKPKQEAVTQSKIHLTDSQVERRLNRVGRRVKTVGDVPNYQSSSGMRFRASGNFSEDFERIENFIANPNVDDNFISDALDDIAEMAYQFGDDKALNFVEYYRYKLSHR